MKNKNKNDNNRLRSIAEAHIYVAVLKADNNVSGREVVEASFYARKSQKWMNVLNVNEGMAENIVEQMQQIIKKIEFSKWDCYAHLDYAFDILSELKRSGEWAVKLTFDKMESGLKKIALIDGYDIHESQFLQLVLSKLKELKKKIDQEG